jgi:membrane protein YqaA with SNARE-associated domain
VVPTGNARSLTGAARSGGSDAISRLTDKTLALARSRHGLWGIFADSFAGSTIAPIPFEAVMTPMFLANRSRI